jgi:Ca-activated chloride channel family protein
VIQWHDPASLAALVLVPALALFLVWSLRRRRQALATFVATGLLPAVTPDLDPRRRTLRAVLLCLAVLAIVLATAGPMWGFRWQQVQRQGIDLIVAIDTSRSMLATDVKPNRLARAKLAVQDLLAQLGGDRVGLVAFAGTAFLQCPLTLDFGAFSQSLEAIEAGIIPRGGTSLAAAIETSLAGFEGRQAEHQALVIITDGEDLGGNLDEAIKQATERGVKIYTVGIGTAEGELIPLEGGGFVKDRKGQVVKSRLDETTLQKIANDTGGAYLHATDTAFGLAELYRDYIATMEKRELASTLERRFEHRFQWPLVIAFLLLLLEPVIGERRPAPRARAAAGRRFPWRRRPGSPKAESPTGAAEEAA